MASIDTQTFKPHLSERTKWYGLIFIIVLALPISYILFLTLEGPLFFSAFMFTVLLSVLFLLAYFTFSSGSLKYEVTPKEFRISIGLLKKRVIYTRIVNVEKVDLSLNIRLFGASLPGFHWGLFRTSIGNAHVYATKISGEFVVVTLDEGEKIALSPQEPDVFIEAIKDKNLPNNIQSLQTLKQEKQSTSRLVYAQVIAVSAAYIAFLGYFFWVYTSLPQIVPVHFGFDGVANRWADKSELLWLAGIALFFPVINAVLSLKFGKHERGMAIVLGAIFVVVIAVFVYSINTIVALA